MIGRPGMGIIEEGLESQKHINKAMYNASKILDMASLTLFYTTNQELGSNALSEMVTGDMLKINHQDKIGVLNTSNPNISNLFSLMDQWQVQFNNSTSTQAVNTGAQLPSSTPYRLGLMQNQEANAPFMQKQEEMGIFINELYKDWILEFLIKKIKKEKDLSLMFTPEEVKIIDSKVQEYLEDKIRIDAILDGTKEIPTEEEIKRMVQDSVKASDTIRSFSGKMDEWFEGYEGSLIVNVTNEQYAKGVMLESLSSIFQTVASNPAVLDDPKLSEIFSQIMNVAGLSDLDLKLASISQNQQTQGQQQQIAGPQPQQRPQPAGLLGNKINLADIAQN
jgi:hypothetical protein